MSFHCSRRVLSGLILLLTGGASALSPSAEAAAPSSLAVDPPVRAVEPPQVKGAKAKSASNLMIVMLEEPPLVRSTAGRTRGPDRQAYLRYLDEVQSRRIVEMERALTRRVEAVFRYRAGTNAIAVQLNRSEARSVARIPGVIGVIPDRLAQLHTDAGPPWIGAAGVWDGTETGVLGAAMGEGTVVGVIDTGINPGHPSFAASSDDGYTHTNPNGSGVFLGWCDPTNPNYDPTFACNDKLIGAWDFADAYCTANSRECSESDGPDDNDGHGSHTSSTAAGNVLDLNDNSQRDISGVAPRANLIIYDSCYYDARQETSFCPLSATAAAADQALLDGVDALNFSIAGGENPWGGDIDTFFLQNVASGTFVAASAGNTGPSPATVEHLAPWIATVGASTHDRDVSAGAQTGIENSLASMSGGISPPSGVVVGTSRTGGTGVTSIVLAGDFNNGDPNPEQCLHPFPPGTWSDQIVLCDRGDISRVLKCQNVAAGGALGCVLANATGTTDPLAADAHIIPATHVDATSGDTLRNWLTGCGNCMARITPASLINDPSQADLMADFSSRGPNDQFDVLKPDLTNPGVLIYAAVDDGQLDTPGLTYQGMDMSWLSGTSMSSPHTAGAGALLKSLHPHWTPMEIKSALMMTADTSVKKENGSTDADPWDMGSGRVDLSKASRAGLLLDETETNFMAADPLLGGSPETLNLASLKQMTCVVECSWQRTFTSPSSPGLGPQGVAVTWNADSSSTSGIQVAADPSPFQIATDNDVTVEFTATAPGLAPGDPPGFAQVTLTPDDGSPLLHLPVLMRIAEDNFPAVQLFESDDRTDSEPIQGLQYHQALSELTLRSQGLIDGTETDVLLDEDPTNNNPYDNLSEVYWKTVSVPPGSRRLVALTESDQVPDVDLFTGTGNMPSSATEVCESTTNTASEYCQILEPTPGTYWIVVQSWEGSNSQPDSIHLVEALVPGSGAGNLTVTGPQNPAAGEAFDVTVTWDVDFSPSGYWFGAFTAATDASSSPFATVGIDLVIQPLFGDGFESGDTTGWSAASP